MYVNLRHGKKKIRKMSLRSKKFLDSIYKQIWKKEIRCEGGWNFGRVEQ
jgi:hypothetical protein